jgi:hypothetical protein
MKPYHPLRALSCAAMFLGVAASWAAPRDLKIEVDPVWIGSPTLGGYSPMRVTVQNTGPNARGHVELQAEGYQMRYPIDLPRGSRKSFIAYVGGLSFYEPSVYVLSTDQGTLRYQYQPVSYPTTGMKIALLSDSPGAMTFIRTPSNESIRSNELVEEVYAKIESAPDRSIGYDGIAAVVLGEGTERLGDREVEALKQYAMSGGTLVFLGGASSPVLEDPRWTSLLPVTAPKPLVKSDSKLLQSLGKEPLPPGLFTVMAARLAKGARGAVEDGVPLTATRGFGFGKVVFVAINPLERPLSKWEGRRAFLLQSIDPSTYSQARAWKAQFSVSDDPYDYYGVPLTSGTVVSGSGEPDPFSAALPETSVVLMILGVYFVLVVPINLLVLRKLGRGELAWITAPLISLGFAGIFFTFAGELYSADLSSATSGVLVVDERSEEGVFSGNSRMFFPRGGRYDLKLENVQAVSGMDMIADYYSSFGPSSGGGLAGKTMSDMNAVDVGEIRAPAVAVSNLSFYQFKFVQTVPQTQWLAAQVSQQGKRISGQIANRSREDMSDVKLYVGGSMYKIGVLKAGESKTFRGEAPAAEPEPSPSPSQHTHRHMYGEADPPSIGEFSKGGRVVAYASLPTFRAGPNIGKEIGKYRRVALAAFLGEVETQ